MRAMLAAVAVLVSCAGAARAEVVESYPGGFRVKETRAAPVTAERAYAAIGEIGRWWEDEHTYSGKAANMTLKLEPGACFCESLPQGGGVRHGVVALALPSRTVRLETALGPLQDEGVAGAFTFQIKPKGQGVEIEMTYHVGGARPSLPAMMPTLVDQVLRTQADRLQRYLATGKPV